MKLVKNRVRVYFCRNAAREADLLVTMPDELVEHVLLEAVPCSGRIDPRYIMKAFESGAPAVCVLTCPRGECKSLEGNLRATRRVLLAAQLLEEAGLDTNAAQIFVPDKAGEDLLPALVEPSSDLPIRHRIR